jgi:glycosyltransferase involved in cell wall biosynthesis
MNSKLKIINSNKIYKDFIPASELLLNNDLILRNYDRKNSVKLLWVGRMEPIKDPFFLIDTLVELNLIYENWTIDIIGSGSIYDLINQKLKQLSGDINKKITLHGQIRNSLLDNYYIKSDILVITSLTENFSITALEALKYKLKVISVPIINYQYSILKDYINSSEDRTPKSLAELIKNSITLSTVHDFESSKLKDVYNSQIIKIINWL